MSDRWDREYINGNFLGGSFGQKSLSFEQKILER
jgi:hypothetical protein